MGTPRWTAGDYPAKRSICPTRSRGQRPPVEHLADDARPLQHGALLEVQPVQAGCQQGGDGAGDGGADQVGGRRPVAAGLAEHALVDQLGDQLSTNSGLPPARSAMLASTSAGGPAPPSSLRTSLAHSSSPRGSSATGVVPGAPGPQPGRSSSGSGRASPISRMVASLAEPATCSRRSSSAGGAR